MMSVKTVPIFTQTTEIVHHLFAQEKDVFLTINVLFVCLKTDLENVKQKKRRQ